MPGTKQLFSSVLMFLMVLMVRANQPYRELAGQSRSVAPLKIHFLDAWHVVSVVHGTLSAERSVSVFRSIGPWNGCNRLE